MISIPNLKLIDKCTKIELNMNKLKPLMELLMSDNAKKLFWQMIAGFAVALVALLFMKCGANSMETTTSSSMWDNLEDNPPDPVARFNAYWIKAEEEPWLLAGGQTVIVCNSGRLAATDNTGQRKKLLPCLEPETVNYYPGGWRQYADDMRACTICSCAAKHR